jgi:MFS family permease
VEGTGGRLDQVKNVFLIQVFNSFVGGILGVVLPLMMEARKVDIVTIGFVFASMPIIFQILRMFFATVSDFWSRKSFFVLNGFLGVVSSLIYYFAHTPLEFLFGKVSEGTTGASLWSVNRAFLLEISEDRWAVLVHLRTVSFISSAVGSLIAGFLIVWLMFEGTLISCALIGGLVIPIALLLASGIKQKFSIAEALHFLDFRNKGRVFKVFLVLFLIMGFSFGFRGGFVIPLFLSRNGFDVELIGVLLGFQMLIAGLFSFLFARRVSLEKLILTNGILTTLTLLLLSFSGSALAGVLLLALGIMAGLSVIGEEGLLSKITSKDSYGIDIGLLWMGFHVGETLSLALAGILISVGGFLVPFLLSALIYIPFYVTSYLMLKK